MEKVNTPHFVYDNNGINLVIPFHPRVYPLADKIPGDKWAKIFTVVFHNIANPEAPDSERAVISEALADMDFDLGRHTVVDEIFTYINNSRDLFNKLFKELVDSYVEKALEIDKVRETTQSGEFTVRKIIFAWLGTVLANMTINSPYFDTWAELVEMFKEKGVLLDPIQFETFGLYDSFAKE